MANARIVSEQLKSEIPRLAASIDRMASSIGGTVNENRSDVHKVVENLRDLSKDLRTTADNLNTITGQMKSGEGTVGKLLFSNEAHDKLTSALSSVESGVTELKNTIGRATRIQMDLGIRGDYYAGLKADDRLDNIGSASRSEISLRLVPNPDNNRFYNIVMAQDPRGRRHDKVFETTVTNPATGESTITTTHETKFERNFVLSAQAGWKLGDFGVRLGVIDNTGGGGIDYQYNDRIRITGELFDFGTKAGRQPHLRAWTEYVVRKEKPHTPMLFVTSGVDNPFNDTAFTFGGGIRWRDDDLKYLLSSVPIK
jgi:phospholipid/cholesterol/gamma-HCH transport system substrate-binding protein